MVIQRSEIVCRCSVALSRRSLVVPGRLGIISLNSLPVFVELAQQEFRIDVALRGRGAQSLYGQVVIRSGRIAVQMLYGEIVNWATASPVSARDSNAANEEAETALC